MDENAFETIPDEAMPLEALLEMLTGKAEHLQRALIERNPEVIMAALAEQEDLMQRLQARQDRPEPGDPAPEDEERRRKVTELAVRARGLQRTNRRLASVFLDVVERTMAYVRKTAAPRECAYDASGTVRASSAPVLVCQQG